MSEYTINIDLPAHKRGDKWPGITAIGPVLINGVQPAVALDRVRMHLVHADGTRYKLDSLETQDRSAPIVISNAATWAANIPAIPNFLSKAGEWSWDMEFYSTGDSAPLTLYKGKLTVLNDVTK
jgi:hypothetical protein